MSILKPAYLQNLPMSTFSSFLVLSFKIQCIFQAYLNYVFFKSAYLEFLDERLLFSSRFDHFYL